MSLIGIYGINMNVKAQDDSIKTAKTKQNSIELILPHYNFLDGSPKVSLRYFGLNNFGVAYNRISRMNKWAISISISYFELWYDGFYLNNHAKPGDIAIRSNLYLSGIYFRNLINTRFTSLYTGAGVNFRGGTEIIYTIPYGWDNTEYPVPLLDAGLRVAVMEKVNLPFNFMLTGQVSFTRYFYRYFRGNGIPPLDGGSTKNLITYRIEVGYRF